jgi:D-glycero-alpha-D-manno-heptose-7-phosphate kinase
MLVGTAPLRISLAGGGTDLPSYAGRKGGVVLGAAIDLSVSVVRRPRLVGGGVRACLDACDVARDAPALTNAFAREALCRHGDGEAVELVSFADAPGGTGLGSSAAFCVALLGVLDGEGADPLAIAERAGDIETAGLGRPVGRQDHYLCALGGFHLLRFERDGQVRAERVEVAPRHVRRLDEELLLFYTGLTRDAASVLAEQDERLRSDDRDVERRLDEIKELTAAMHEALTRGDAGAVGEILGRHWSLKKGLSRAVSPASVDTAYADSRAAGATGGKLVGAGGGGHLLVHVPTARQAAVRAALRRHGYVERAFTLGGPGLRISAV